MEKLVFKNLYLNMVIGGLLIVLSLVGYLMGWLEDFIEIFVGVLLLLLSTKRFIFSFKKIVSKNATLILILEFLLDIVFVGLLLYLQDHLSIFVGLIIYIRGMAYLLINYIATRKIKLFQYVLNIGFVTLGSFFMFSSFDSELVLILGLALLLLVVGAIYLQAGLVELVRKEELEEKLEEEQRVQEKQVKEKQKQDQKLEKIEVKSEQRIAKLETEVKQEKEKVKATTEEKKKLEKQLDKAAVAEKPILATKTVAELKQMAKDRGLTGYSQFTKAELIKLLTERK